MKIFAIRDEYQNKEKDLAFLIYHEKEQRFTIELPEQSDPWEVPLLLSSFVKRGIDTIDSHWSGIWVQQRIVPPDRQNLGQILKDNKLKAYDEYKLLMLSMGRCEQDDYYLIPLREDEIPEYIKKRLKKTIKTAIPISDQHMLVFFRDGTTIKYHAEAVFRRLMAYYSGLHSEDLLQNANVSAGGLGINWGSEVSVSKEEVLEHGEEIALSLTDLKQIIQRSLINSAEAAEILRCSRQNIDDLVKRGKLQPVKKSDKSMLFMKNEILERAK